MLRYRSPLPCVANAAAETRAVRGQLTGDRRRMTSGESLFNLLLTGPPYSYSFADCRVIGQEHTLSVDLLSPSCNRHLVRLWSSGD